MTQRMTAHANEEGLPAKRRDVAIEFATVLRAATHARICVARITGAARRSLNSTYQPFPSI